jgi:hypothetical protein
MNHDPAKQAWQASVEIAGSPSLEEVRRGADKFYRFVWWRNATEYAACVIAVVVFSYYVFSLPHVLQKAGSVMVVLATVWGAWQLHRRGSAEPPERAGTTSIYAFQRRQLARHRDATRSILWWYMLPFVPGLATISAGSAIARAEELSRPVRFGWIGAALTAAFIAAFAGIWWFNQRIANRLQQHIDEIDALTEGSHEASR